MSKIYNLMRLYGHKSNHEIVRGRLCALGSGRTRPGVVAEATQPQRAKRASCGTLAKACDPRMVDESAARRSDRVHVWPKCGAGDAFLRSLLALRELAPRELLHRAD